MKMKGGSYALKKLMFKFGGIVAGLALTVTALNVNTTCIYLIHQPKLPKGSDKLRKF